MRAALLQLNGSDDPARSLRETGMLFDEAVAAGADIVLTPELTNIVSSSRTRQEEILCDEEKDPTLAALRARAGAAGLWLVIGSLVLRAGDGRFANRSFLIGPDGDIRARYDKIHMFDADLGNGSVFRESAAFRPGDTAVTADTPFGRLGLSICYDIRFPGLYRSLAQAGALFLTIPAAFTPPTGAAHWEPLLRARAIETGSFILAPAQCGAHAVSRGRPRASWGHSMIVSPWGEVLAEHSDDTPGLLIADLDPDAARDARARIPSLTHDRPFTQIRS